MTQPQASLTYGISRSTVKNKFNGAHANRTGRARVFADEEGKTFKEYIIKICDLWFLTSWIRFSGFLKRNLNNTDAVVSKFKQILPGFFGCTF